ncbi:family 10 glycosylhydrolase [Bacteroides sedimenti]
MINRRKFIKAGIIAGLSATIMPDVLKAAEPWKKKKQHGLKHWIWINPKAGEDEAMLTERYKRYYDAGIRGILFENDVEAHFRIAKSQGLETHRWLWTMNRGDKNLMQEHPEWYAVNRKGESCIEKPPYVNYYRWLCPSKEEVQRYILNNIQSILENKYVDGIHLDYIRYCDIVLPVNLWENYHIEQTRELPEYDYCYCDTCRSKFKEQFGMNLIDIQYPEASLSWRQFRYNSITQIVNSIAKIANEHGKKITAAVFPTPEVARRNVRQDWINWNLTGIFPMIYHRFYKENIPWIGDAVKEGVRGIDDRFPLYAGLHLPDFKDDTELREGIKYALNNGAQGVSFYGDVTDNVLGVLKEFLKYKKI